MTAPATGAQPTARDVADRLCDLLLCFPCAAWEGVRWRVLTRKYEERFSVGVDLAALGLSTPVAAATVLLWNVLGSVDSQDEADPLLRIDDSVSLIPKPGRLGCWPSLYHALHEIARGYGDKGLLLSRLKPLLLRHWHAGFEEGSLGFLSSDGSPAKSRKMKHLVQDVRKWRNERLAWREAQGLRPTQVDEVLAPGLELVPSESHNDLVLRCARRALAAEPTPAQPRALAASPAAGAVEAGGWAGEERRPTDPFDDPFEPPPEASPWKAGEHPWRWSLGTAGFSSTAAGSEAGGPDAVSESCVTPTLSLVDHLERLRPGAASTCGVSSSATLGLPSGSATPVPAAAFAQEGYALVPMWFSLVPSAPQFSVIPQGIVRSICAQFEPRERQS